VSHLTSFKKKNKIKVLRESKKERKEKKRKDEKK